jgi:hypothetical protein
MAGLLEDPVQYGSITQLAAPWGPGQLTYNEGTQCALMVDEYSRVIVNDNQPAVNSSNGLFSPASVPTPWNEVGKCTFQVSETVLIMLYRNTNLLTLGRPTRSILQSAKCPRAAAGRHLGFV